MKLDIKQILTDFDPLAVHPLEMRATVDAMLENLGCEDAELRERLIFPIFTKLISEGFLSSDELIRIMDVCLDDDHLFLAIGEESDAVFVRADSSSIISAILEYNTKQTFLPIVRLDEVVARILQYLLLEEDGRCYVEGRGWAHAVANGLDMLGCVVANMDVPQSRFPDVLTAIEGCLFKKVTYFHQEGERAAAVVRAMMDRGFGSEALKLWMMQMIDRLEKTFAAQGFTFKYQCNNVNVTNFLKSLYFNYKIDNERVKLRVDIFDAIKRLQRF